MTKLPIIKSRKLIRVLLKIGFEQTHKKGSHFFFRHSDGRTTVVPVHKGRDIGRGLLRKILHDIKISPEEFKKLLRKKR